MALEREPTVYFSTLIYWKRLWVNFLSCNEKSTPEMKFLQRLPVPIWPAKRWTFKLFQFFFRKEICLPTTWMSSEFYAAKHLLQSTVGVNQAWGEKRLLHVINVVNPWRFSKYIQNNLPIMLFCVSYFNHYWLLSCFIPYGKANSGIWSLQLKLGKYHASLQIHFLKLSFGHQKSF